MKLSHSHPLVKLPPRIELTLLLIREDLKSHKFFSTLDQVGISDCYYQPNLSRAVLAYAGFEEVTDKISEFYGRLLDEACEKVQPDQHSIMKEVFRIYTELMIEKKRLK